MTNPFVIAVHLEHVENELVVKILSRIWVYTGGRASLSHFVDSRFLVLGLERLGSRLDAVPMVAGELAFGTRAIRLLITLLTWVPLLVLVEDTLPIFGRAGTRVTPRFSDNPDLLGDVLQSQPQIQLL